MHVVEINNYHVIAFYFEDDGSTIDSCYACGAWNIIRTQKIHPYLCFLLIVVAMLQVVIRLKIRNLNLAGLNFRYKLWQKLAIEKVSIFVL